MFRVLVPSMQISLFEISLIDKLTKCVRDMPTGMLTSSISCERQRGSDCYTIKWKNRVMWGVCVCKYLHKKVCRKKHQTVNNDFLIGGTIIGMGDTFFFHIFKTNRYNQKMFLKGKSIMYQCFNVIKKKKYFKNIWQFKVQKWEVSLVLLFLNVF